MSDSQKPNYRRVLIVDDNKLNLDMLSEFTDLLGHEVFRAENGKVGLELARSHSPDIILLAIDMPVMNGLEMLEALRADKQLVHIPVIMISGSDRMDNIVRSLELGATDFLAKPFNPAVLKARLLSSFERKDLRDRERELLLSLEESYADLSAAEKSKDALTHMIVHDLGNPLSVITMNAEMLQMVSATGAVSPEALGERLGYITTASDSMGTMIQSILDVSKFESGQMSVTPERINVPEFFLGLSAHYQGVALERGITIKVDTSECDGSVMIDRTLLERILANLITNAFKYATTASHIVLGASRAHGVVSFWVQDDGEGIPKEASDRIFDKYYQIESRSAGGTRAGVGLGLAFCKMASKAMGGDIKVHSANPHGTRFHLSLPSEPTI